MTVVRNLLETRGPIGFQLGNETVSGGGRAELSVVDPCTETSIAEVCAGSPQDGRDAIDLCCAVQRDWAAAAPRWRSELLFSAYQYMRAAREDFAHLIVLENGKTLTDALAEVDYAAEFFRWYSEQAVRIDGQFTRAPNGSGRIIVSHEPVGPCLLITPWNFPAAMITRKLAPALAAGCTAVVKPASATPLTALAIGRMLAELGLPNGVVSIVPARSSAEFVSAVLQKTGVRKLSFTGSTAVGSALLSEVAPQVINSSMELGGNAPFLVLDAADVPTAVAGAVIAKMRNAGQACTAANRFYVHASIVDEFTSRLAEAMLAMRVGPGTSPTSEVGPLIDDAARTGVLDLVREAKDLGATCHQAADLPAEGYFHAPTVLELRDGSQPILHEEIFGPVAPVVAFESTEEAIRLANSSDLGLAAYVYASDLRQGMDVADAIESGMVAVNRPMVSEPAAPFGGVKQSGLGREGGQLGILEYLEPKYIALGP